MGGGVQVGRGDSPLLSKYVPALDAQLSLQFLIAEFVPYIMKEFEKGKFMTVENNVASGGRFLLGFRGHLYQIDSDFQVNRFLSGDAAVGCGDEMALAAMAAFERINRTLEIVSELNTGVCWPFTLLEGGAVW